MAHTAKVDAESMRVVEVLLERDEYGWVTNGTRVRLAFRVPEETLPTDTRVTSQPWH